MFGLSLYIFISLVSYSSLDPSLSSVSSLSGDIVNLGGPFGAYLSDALFSVIGVGAYLFLTIISFAAVKTLFFYQQTDSLHKAIQITSAIFLISSFSTLCEFYSQGIIFHNRHLVDWLVTCYLQTFQIFLVLSAH